MPTKNNNRMLLLIFSAALITPLPVTADTLNLQRHLDEINREAQMTLPLKQDATEAALSAQPTQKQRDRRTIIQRLRLTTLNAG